MVCLNSFYGVAAGGSSCLENVIKGQFSPKNVTVDYLLVSKVSKKDDMIQRFLMTLLKMEKNDNQLINLNANFTLLRKGMFIFLF